MQYPIMNGAVTELIFFNLTAILVEYNDCKNKEAGINRPQNYD